MKKQFLEIGKVVTIRGLDGEVKLECWGDGPDELASFERMYLNEGKKELKVERVRNQKGMALIKFEGINTPEAAESLRGKIVYINRDDEELEEGQYYIQDIMGLSVYDVDTNELYGTICDYTETGANLVYHIKFADGSIKLIPVIDEVVINVDVDGGRMDIRPLKGLFDDDSEI